MTRLLLILALCPVAVMAGTPSYWFGQLQSKPDAKTAQEFWFVAGTNILMTYKTNHVIINVLGGTNTGPPGPQGPQGIQGIPGTNGLNGTNAAVGIVSNYFTTNIAPYGIDVTQVVAFFPSGGSTNIYSKGLLVAAQTFTHLSSLIKPGGGYLLQPNLGTILLP